MTHTSVLTPCSIVGYEESSGYDSNVELFVEDFGARLRVVREARGFKELTALAEHVFPGDDEATALERQSFINYLSRVELKNKNVGINYQQFLARILGFPTLSAFWIAIEKAPELSQQGLISAGAFVDNPSLLAAPKADLDAATFSDSVIHIDSVIIQAAETITTAIRDLADRLAPRQQPAASPRDQTSGRR